VASRKKLNLNANDVVVLEPDKLAPLLEKYVVKDGGHWWFKRWDKMSRKPSRTGYAKVNAGYWAGGGRSPMAHRWVWMQLVGPIAGGMVHDHLCVYKGCVNPSHLEMVTGDENSRRGDRTRCVERGDGTRFALPSGDDICVHDDRPIGGYELRESPSVEAVAMAAARPPRPKKKEARTSTYVSRKLWDGKTHRKPVWDELPVLRPGVCREPLVKASQ
jgi:hypothetical protein